jgi:hypothetical protein
VIFDLGLESFHDGWELELISLPSLSLLVVLKFTWVLLEHVVEVRKFRLKDKYCQRRRQSCQKGRSFRNKCAIGSREVIAVIWLLVGLLIPWLSALYEPGPESSFIPTVVLQGCNCVYLLSLALSGCFRRTVEMAEGNAEESPDEREVRPLLLDVLNKPQ